MVNTKEDFFVPDFERPLVDLEYKINELKKKSSDNNPEVINEIKSLEQEAEKLKKRIFGSLNPYQRVLLARHPKRPYTLDYIHALFTNFVELHGDRSFADDKAVVTGLAFFEKKPVVIVGQQKGKTVNENMTRNFGMMHPEGYRKALRAMKLAEKFGKPLIVFIDTMGAYPGIGAEERGQGEAIARNLREMVSLNTSTVCIIIGEGSSGGALGIGVVDRILMLENTYYSVISPEGCAAILYSDANRASDAASALKLTAQDLFELGIADEIIPEPLGGCNRDFPKITENIRLSLKKHISQLAQIPINKLVELRYKKYRKIGNNFEQPKIKKHKSN